MTSTTASHPDGKITLQNNSLSELTDSRAGDAQHNNSGSSSSSSSIGSGSNGVGSVSNPHLNSKAFMNGHSNTLPHTNFDANFQRELDAGRSLKTKGLSLESSGKHEPVHPVYEPYQYLVQNTEGKNIRSRLIDSFNNWLHVDEDDIRVVKTIVSKLHNASLLIDDIEDNSNLRRGIPCAHLIFGVPGTINSANYMYFEALRDCLSFKSETSRQNAILVFIEELENLHRGQALDIYWRDNLICPSEEEYMHMVRDKTGGLFRLSVRLMQSCSSEKRELIPFVNTLADIFQVLDDFLNLQDERYHANKSFCEDLTEGKFSFPTIHAINSDPHDKRLLRILKQHTKDVDLKKYAIEVMKSKGSFEYTKKVILKKKEDLLAMLADIGRNDDVKAIIESMTKDIVLSSSNDTPS